MLRKGFVLTSLFSAMLGAALVWFAAGERQNRVIDDWIPLNTEIAAAMSLQETAAQPQIEPMTQPEAAPANSAPLHASVSDGAAVTPPLQTAQSEMMAAASNVISINTASLTELMEIPGIGEKKAQAIIQYRTSHGLFKAVEDLTMIKGIGDKMLEKMKPYIGL